MKWAARAMGFWALGTAKRLDLDLARGVPSLRVRRLVLKGRMSEAIGLKSTRLHFELVLPEIQGLESSKMVCLVQLLLVHSIEAKKLRYV